VVQINVSFQFDFKRNTKGENRKSILLQQTVRIRTKHLLKKREIFSS